MIRTDWDYTGVVTSYTKRPRYSARAVERFLAVAGLLPGMLVCDIGAGTGNLTVELLSRNLKVVALEPNQQMRKAGRGRTPLCPEVRWMEATAESTGQPDDFFHAVTFGSSFNVVDQPRALVETARILRPTGWLGCLWNYRDLDDPLQRRIEERIHELVPNYQYGRRREDQVDVILASALFEKVERFEDRFSYVLTVTDWMDAWNSHLTLRRQAGTRFPEILKDIENLLRQKGSSVVQIPYITRLWVAQRRG